MIVPKDPNTTFEARGVGAVNVVETFRRIDVFHPLT